MTRKLALLPFVISLALAIGAACAPTETGNPSFTTTTSASLVAYSSDESVIAIGGTTGLRVDRLLVSYARVDLSDCHGEPAQTGVVGPFADDLTARPPAEHELDTTLESFCRIDIPLVLGETTSELPGNVMLVEGHRADGVVFRLRSALLRHFVLDTSPAGVGLGEASQRLLVAFDVSRWFASLDLDVASVNADGTIHIDQAENTAILTAFETGLEHSASLHRDDDSDGIVDPEETRLDH
jgi:hypothetical protein